MVRAKNRGVRSNYGSLVNNLNNLFDFFFRHRRSVTIAVLLIYAAVMISVMVPLPFNAPADAWGDCHVLIAGSNFEELGFSSLKYQPLVQPTSDPIKGDFYTHYPPLPELMNGVYRTWGIDNLGDFRIIALFMTLLAIFIAGELINLLFGNKIALLSVFFMAFSKQMLYFGTNIHKFGFEFLFGFLSLYLLTLYLTKKDKLFLILSCASFLILTYSTIDFVPFVLFSGAVITYFKTPKKAFKTSFRIFSIFLIILILSTFFHFFIHNSALLGTKGAVNDVFGTFAYRVTGMENDKTIYSVGEDFEGSLVKTVWNYAKFPYEIVNRIAILGIFDIFMFAAFIGLVIFELKKKLDKNKAMLIFLGLCGLIWYLTFMQHFLWHKHFQLHHLLLFFSVAKAIVILKVIELLKSKKILSISISILIVLLLILNIFAFGYYYQVRHVVEQEKFKEQLYEYDALKSSFDINPNTVIISDDLAKPCSRYFFDIPIYANEQGYTDKVIKDLRAKGSPEFIYFNTGEE